MKIDITQDKLIVHEEKNEEIINNIQLEIPFRLKVELRFGIYLESFCKWLMTFHPNYESPMIIEKDAVDHLVSSLKDSKSEIYEYKAWFKDKYSDSSQYIGNHFTINLTPKPEYLKKLLFVDYQKQFEEQPKVPKVSSSTLIVEEIKKILKKDLKKKSKVKSKVKSRKNP